jgi:ribonuclease P protein component
VARENGPSRFSFGPERRLRRHSEFVVAQRDGRRIGTRHFTLLVAAQAVPGPARLGLVVARKIGNAVRRNRVKRLCRECFRTLPNLVPPGIDLVVIARPGAEGLKLDDVRAEWLSVERLVRKRAGEALAHRSSRHHLGGEPRQP